MTAYDKEKPLKSRFTFRLGKPGAVVDRLTGASILPVEYLFDDKQVAREDWVALQQHMFLKAVGNGSERIDDRSLFERVFGKGVL